MQELLELHEEEGVEGDAVRPGTSTLIRRKRRKASLDGADYADEEDGDAEASDPTPERDMLIDSAMDDLETRTINFEKFYHLHEIIVEIEAFRTVSYQDSIHVDKDSTAMVLTHMKDFTLADGDSSVQAEQGAAGQSSASSVVANKSDKSVRKMTSFAKMRGSSSTDMPGATA